MYLVNQLNYTKLNRKYHLSSTNHSCLQTVTLYSENKKTRKKKTEKIIYHTIHTNRKTNTSSKQYQQYWPDGQMEVKKIFYTWSQEHMYNTYISSAWNKPPDHCTCNRPISWINTDIKIMRNALAAQIESVIPSLSHPDQPGLLKVYLTTHNISSRWDKSITS